MAVKRRRQPKDTGDLEDPQVEEDLLSNYEPAVFEDDLERALSEDELGQLEITPVETVGPDWTIGKVIDLMAEHAVASVMIVEGDKLLGIFSERDVLNRVADHPDDLLDQPITSVMTAEPVVAHETDSPAKAMNLMAVSGVRHVPILDVDDKLIGVLGPRRLGRYIQSHSQDAESTGA